MPKVYVTKEFVFEAAHHLENYVGACANLHGHSYKLQVTCSGEITNFKTTDVASEGMVIDFKDLKEIVKLSIVDKLDHSYLNEHFTNPTAETMVISIFNTLRYLMPKGVKLERVKLWETATSFAEYRGE